MKYLLVGLGNIGAKRLALLGDRCIGTVDPYNKEATYRDVRNCKPALFDAVILSVPNQVKIELIHYFLELGKHVLVEKPLLFPDESTAQHLAAIAKKNKAICYTSYNHRFEPLIEEAKKEIDSGVLGKIYTGKLFYGNGTVAHVVGSWREEGLGVLEDLGPHLLDLAAFLFDDVRGIGINPLWLKRHESKALDHCLLETEDQRFLLETSFISWKNNFKIELYGEKGSLHLQGLCKWGPSELTICERIFPSGVPKERRKTITGSDVTWKKDLDYFESAIAAGLSSFENDQWISKVLRNLGPASLPA